MNNLNPKVTHRRIAVQNGEGKFLTADGEWTSWLVRAELFHLLLNAEDAAEASGEFCGTVTVEATFRVISPSEI
jgi:hypothetical protein